MRRSVGLGRHVDSAFSRGAGYERTPLGRHFDPDAVRGYPLDFTAKTSSSSANHSSLLPAAHAQLALGWWERHLGGDPAAESRFLETCAALEAEAVKDRDAVVWRYDVPLRKYGLAPGWISGLAQGQAASVLVRAYSLSNDDRHAELAQAAIRPLLDVEPPTVLAQSSEGPVPEECPTSPPSLILNGWIYAVWGLREVAVAFGSERALRMFEESVACLVSLLPRYDVGWWSRYSLYPHRLPDLAKIFYHRLHIDQLRAMELLTGEDVFGRTAARWEEYDKAPKRVALVAHKAAFVASRYR